MAEVSEVFEGRVAVGNLSVVVEDGIVVCWWHTFLFQAGRWELYSTHHAVVESEDDSLLVYADDGNSEPDFVDELTEES
jgi:hypothetical protein